MVVHEKIKKQPTITIKRLLRLSRLKKINVSACVVSAVIYSCAFSTSSIAMYRASDASSTVKPKIQADNRVASVMRWKKAKLNHTNVHISNAKLNHRGIFVIA